LFGDVLTTAVDTVPPPPPRYGRGGASRETSRDSETGGMPRSLLEHVVARAAGGGVWARPGGGGLLWRLLVGRGAHLLAHDETRRLLMRMLRSAVAMTTGGPAAAADVGMSGYTEMLTDVAALFNVSHTHTHIHTRRPSQALASPNSHPNPVLRSHFLPFAFHFQPFHVLSHSSLLPARFFPSFFLFSSPFSLIFSPSFSSPSPFLSRHFSNSPSTFLFFSL